MGIGPDLKNLKKLSSVLSLDDYVDFVGYKVGDEKYDYYKKSHILVLPSYSEGFPNVICEAMASGLAVIGTRTGGIVDAIKDGVNGYLLENLPPKPEEISEKILQIIEQESSISKMGKKNYEESQLKYDTKVVTKDMERIYLSLAT